MIIAKIILHLQRQFQSVVPPPCIPQLVLPLQVKEESYRTSDTHPQEPQADPKSELVCRCLPLQVNIAGNDATNVSDPNLHGRADTTLVMARDIIAKPYQDNGLSNVSAAGDEIEGKISSADWDRKHIQKNCVANRRNATTNDYECKSVPEPVCYYCCDQCTHCRNNEDWNSHDLSTNRSPAQLFGDGGSEKRSRIACLDDPHVHEHAEPNLDIGKATFGSILVPVVHGSSLHIEC